MENAVPAIMAKDIHDLPFSPALTHWFDLNNFRNLGNLLEQRMESWFEYTGFSQHALNELMNFLEASSLTSYVEE